MGVLPWGLASLAVVRWGTRVGLCGATASTARGGNLLLLGALVDCGAAFEGTLGACMKGSFVHHKWFYEI